MDWGSGGGAFISGGFGREWRNFGGGSAGGACWVDPWDGGAGTLDLDRKGGMVWRLTVRIGDVAEGIDGKLGLF
jgi:hypothetical protein